MFPKNQSMGLDLDGFHVASEHGLSQIHPWQGFPHWILIFPNFCWVKQNPQLIIKQPSFINHLSVIHVYLIAQKFDDSNPYEMTLIPNKSYTSYKISLVHQSMRHTPSAPLTREALVAHALQVMTPRGNINKNAGQPLCSCKIGHVLDLNSLNVYIYISYLFWGGIYTQVRIQFKLI